MKKYGTLCLVAADNLASNVLGGFKEGSTANRGCRHCLATPSEISTIFTECNLTLHTHADHTDKCNLLDAATTQRDRNQLSVEFGINCRSLLHGLKYFNVCSGALVQDIMHDVLEGTSVYFKQGKGLESPPPPPPIFHAGLLEYEAKELLIQHITQDDYYSLDQQITGTELGYMESKDRSSLILMSTLHGEDHKLKQEGMVIRKYSATGKVQSTENCSAGWPRPKKLMVTFCDRMA